MRIIQLLLAILLFANRSWATDDFEGVKGIVQRRIPWLVDKIQFNKIERKDSGDVFRIRTVNNHLIVDATSSPAAAMAVHHYLRYYCHQSFSLMNENIVPLKLLPVINGVDEKNTPFTFRHGNYHCTLNYTQSFWGWKEWERCIDWYALNGVNLIVTLVGTEAVEQQVLREFGYDDKEIFKILTGPAYGNWHWLGNLEGEGGPTTQNLVNRQLKLQQKILKRLDELEINPILQGFSGLVPISFKQKFPKADTVDQGDWMGYKRPVFLQTSDPLFSKFAEAWYKDMEKLYGKRRFFSSDILHEGGKGQNIDVARVTRDIQNAMLLHNKESVWIVQAWSSAIWNDTDDYSEGTPIKPMIRNFNKEHTMILDLWGESDNAWERRKGFSGTPFMWGTVTSWGGRGGLYAKLDRIVEEVQRAYKMYPKLVRSVGINPEAIETTPVWIDLVYTIAWNTETNFDVTSWLKEYTQYRYGVNIPSVQKAWDILHHTVFKSIKEKLTSPPEALFFAKPDTGLVRVSCCGDTNIYYPPLELENAVRLMLSAADRLRNSEPYRYDLLEMVRQVLANRGNETYKQMMIAFRSKDKAGFVKHSNHFLALMKKMDELCNVHSQFRVHRWLGQARTMGTNAYEKNLCEYNARKLITYWGPTSEKSQLHDYSHRQWAGLIRDYYYPRWQKYIDYLTHIVSDETSVKPDFNEMAETWVSGHSGYTDKPTGDLFKISKEIMNQ